MSERYPGGFITKTPPTLNPALGNSTPGVWTLDQVMQNIKAGTWPAYDPYFEYTTLLLHGNGTNGAQNNTFLDSSTNNFTITRNGNTTQGTFTPYGSNWSNYFDGSGDYLTVASNAALDFGSGDFTIEGWFYFTSNNGSLQTVWAYRSTTGTYGGACMVLDGSFNITLYLTNSTSGWTASNVSTGLTASLNQWQHIALVRSGNTITTYKNGVAGTPYTYTTSIVGAGGWSIMAGSNSGGQEVQGYVSNYRIVKGTAVYTTNFTPSTSPLTAITNTSLLTCQSNRFIDNSSNAFTITRNGDVSVQRFSPFNPSVPYAAGTIGGSGYFDGSGDYLTVADNAVLEPGSSNFTIEAWIYPTASATHAGIVCHYGGSGAQAIAFDLATLTPQMNISSNGSTWDIASGVGSTAVSLYTWNHVAIVRNSNTFTIYVNGNSSGTATSSSSVANISSTWSIGANTGTGSEPLTGYISNARVVIGTAVYTANFTPPTAPLTAIANTQLLCSFTNGGIIDNAMMNDLETVGNAQISTTQSKFGGASLAFNGSTDYLTSPQSVNIDLPGDFTVECWIYFGSVSGTSAIVGKWGGSGAYAWVLQYISGTGLRFYTGVSGGVGTSIAGAWTPSTGVWYHIAVSRSSGSVRLFVNGSQVGTTTTNTDNCTTSNQALNIGRNADTNIQYLNGYIDDLRITKGYARYTANFTPPTAAFPLS